MELDKVKKEIEQLNNQQSVAETSSYETTAKIQQLEQAIQTTKAKCEEEEMNTYVHSHMTNRLKRDMLSFQMIKKDLEKAL